MLKMENIALASLVFIIIVVMAIFSFELYKNIFWFNNPTVLQCIVNKK